MIATALFVYGTLRHDQPEHAKYCRGVTGWRPAIVSGRLFRIPEGYLLLVVPGASVLLHATKDARTDEARRAALTRESLIDDESDDGSIVNGELLEFRDAEEAWPPLDAWENFAPGRPGVYPRCVIPVWIREKDAPPRLVFAWAYAATEPPEGSIVPVAPYRSN